MTKIRKKGPLADVLYPFVITRMPHTRANLLRYALLFALGRVKVQGRKGVITHADRD